MQEDCYRQGRREGMAVPSSMSRTRVCMHACTRAGQRDREDASSIAAVDFCIKSGHLSSSSPSPLSLFPPRSPSLSCVPSTSLLLFSVPLIFPTLAEPFNYISSVRSSGFVHLFTDFALRRCCLLGICISGTHLSSSLLDFLLT
jgi:hypothetical protein